MGFNVYSILKEIAKTNQMQNLFSASKEINGIYLFENRTELTKIQHIFINYLYFFDSLYIDIMLGEVSEKVLDSEVYAEAYSYWKRKGKKKQNKEEKKQNDIHLVPGKTINFKKKEKSNLEG